MVTASALSSLLEFYILHKFLVLLVVIFSKALFELLLLCGTAAAATDPNYPTGTLTSNGITTSAAALITLMHF